MTHLHDDIEHRWQQAAEAAADAGTTNVEAPGVRGYRLLYRTLPRIQMPEPPATFGQDIERAARLATTPRGEAVEHWGVRAGVVALLGLLVASLTAYALPLWLRWKTVAAPIPWPMLAVTAIVLIALAWIDRAKAHGASDK